MPGNPTSQTANSDNNFGVPIRSSWGKQLYWLCRRLYHISWHWCYVIYFCLGRDHVQQYCSTFFLNAPVYSLCLHLLIPFVESFWILRGTQRPWPPALESPFSSGNPCTWPVSLTHPISQLCNPQWLTFILSYRVDTSWSLIDSSTIYFCYIQSSVRTYLLGSRKSRWCLRQQFQLSLWSYHIRAYHRDVRACSVSDARLPFREAHVHERIRHWNMCVYNLCICHAMMCFLAGFLFYYIVQCLYCYTVMFCSSGNVNI